MANVLQSTLLGTAYNGFRRASTRAAGLGLGMVSSNALVRSNSMNIARQGAGMMLKPMLIGAGAGMAGNMALTMGSNVMNGNSMFDGVGRAGMRGAIGGGLAGGLGYAAYKSGRGASGFWGRNVHQNYAQKVMGPNTAWMKGFGLL